MIQAKQGQKAGRLIGILGGMGPEATLDLYRHILNLTPAAKDQDHIRVLIYSNPKIPDRTKAIAGAGESPLPCLIESARLLQKAGAGIIAMPCNAAHHYLPEMQQRVRVPILDMIEETYRRFCERLPGARAVGLIASMGAVRSGVYQRAFARDGIQVLMPGSEDQIEVENGIAGVKAGIHDQSVRVAFQSVGTRLFRAGAEAVILGCTEVPLAFDSDRVDYPIFNSTQILAEAAVNWALERENNNK
jgi:aspartate racemase